MIPCAFIISLLFSLAMCVFRCVTQTMVELPLLMPAAATAAASTSLVVWNASSLVRRGWVHGISGRRCTHVTHGLTVGHLLRHPVSAATATTATPASGVSLSWSTVTVSGDVGGRPLLLLIVKLFVERYGLAIVQGLETILVDLGIMNKDVFRAIGRGDEPEALVAKKLYSSLK